MSAGIEALVATVEHEGFAAIPGAFPRAWAQALREDFGTADAHSLH